MFCRKCGSSVPDGYNFCNNCGEPINSVNININNNIPNKNNKSNTTLFIILGVVGGIIFLGIIIVVASILLFSSNSSSNKMVCESTKGSITIRYNNYELIGYNSKGMSYDFDEQNEYAKKIGVDKYLEEFNEWFTSNTDGECVINNKSLKKDNVLLIGDANYGYLEIPNTWKKFYDVDNNDSIQYTYDNQFIVSLNYFKETKFTAQQYASNYMYNKKNSSEVTNVTGEKVKIGKNNSYDAYKISMYYPKDNVYLITYLFDAEDNKVHYIAVEGPKEYDGIKIDDLYKIPKSFSLKK